MKNINAHEAIIVLFDDDCPFCHAEIGWIKRWDKNNRLRLVDISASDFSADAWGFSYNELSSALHVRLPQKGWIKGMPAIRELYRAVNHGWIFAITGWPLLSPLSDRLYAYFARHRLRLSKILGYQHKARVCNDRCKKTNDLRLSE